MFQNSSFVTLYSKQIWSKNRPRAVSYFPFGSQHIESMRPKSFFHPSKGMPENKPPAKQTKNKKDVLAPNNLTGSDQKTARLFSKRFFQQIPGAIGKQTNKTAKQTNTCPRLICCTCTKRAFLKSDSFFFLDVSEFGYEYVSHMVLFPLNHIYLFTRTPNSDLKQILNIM